MMQLAWNLEEVISHLNDYQRKQVPFALAVALNTVAEDRQRGQRNHIYTQLTIRNAVARANFGKVIRFARADRADKNKGKFSAELRVLGGSVRAEAPMLQRLSQIVIRQEGKEPATSNMQYRKSGGRKASTRQFTGGFAIPAPGMRTANQGVPRSLYPVNLGLTLRRTIEGGFDYNSQYKGGGKKNQHKGGRTKRRGFRKNTRFYFAVEKGRAMGIFERRQLSSTKTLTGTTPTGGKYSRTVYESRTTAVWFFRRTLKPSRRIDLDGQFLTGLETQMATEFDERLVQALETARPGGGRRFTSTTPTISRR